jgi:hypothetical protein
VLRVLAQRRREGVDRAEVELIYGKREGSHRDPDGNLVGFDLRWDGSDAVGFRCRGRYGARDGRDPPGERQGRRRLSGLTQPERELYRWILHRFAAAAPPSGETTRATARELELDPHEALAALARDDLVHADPDGQLVVAYPFSARERDHRVLIGEIHEVEAMCAIDALGIAPMLGLPIEVRSHDPISAGSRACRLHPLRRAELRLLLRRAQLFRDRRERGALPARAPAERPVRRALTSSGVAPDGSSAAPMENRGSPGGRSSASDSLVRPGKLAERAHGRERDGDER